MAKQKVTVTIDPDVLVTADADAKAAGLNRSEYVERALREAHYAGLVAQASPPPPLPDSDERRLRELLAWQASLGVAPAG